MCERRGRDRVKGERLIVRRRRENKGRDRKLEERERQRHRSERI